MKRCLLIFFSLIMIFNLISLKSYGVTFSDLQKEHWAYNSIMILVEDGVINGYTDGTYKPEREVTRGEFIKLIMVSLYEGDEYFKTNNFNLGHWAYPYAIEAAMSGYLMSDTDISNMDGAISRKEMVHILAKICIQNNIEKDEIGKSKTFLDTSSLDEESKIYVDFVTANGLINGYTDGTFKADRTMTRAEVATVINRFINLKS